MKKNLCPKCNKKVEIKKDIYNKKDYFYCFNCKTTGETKFLKQNMNKE